MTEPGAPDPRDVELAHLRELLASAHRENDLLRNLLSDAARPRGAGASSLKPIQIGSRERMAMLEHAIEKLDDFAGEMAQYDCYDCEPDALCKPCRARTVLEHVKDWRYGGSTTTPSRRFVGSFHERTTNGWNPREAKIHAAWVAHMEQWGSDRTLGMILTEDRKGPTDWPTPRDWYVATSVVQWLATNVGSCILDAAGWRYAHYKEDADALDAKRAEEGWQNLPSNPPGIPTP